MTDEPTLNLASLTIGLFGGLAIFLYGLEKLTAGLPVRISGGRKQAMIEEAPEHNAAEVKKIISNIDQSQ